MNLENGLSARLGQADPASRTGVLLEWLGIDSWADRLRGGEGQGSKVGRKQARGQKKISLVSKLIRDGETPISEVCDAVGVSRATLYRYLEPDGSPRRRTGQS
jgi:hypothetical protein